jgi:hypothetical protein
MHYAKSCGGFPSPLQKGMAGGEGLLGVVISRSCQYSSRPWWIRGDGAFGNEALMTQAESRGQNAAGVAAGVASSDLLTHPNFSMA